MRIRRHAQGAHRGLELFLWRQHVRQVRLVVRDVFNVEETRAGNPPLQELGARVAAEARHVPRPIEHDDVREVGGEPFGGDQGRNHLIDVVDLRKVPSIRNKRQGSQA